MKCDNWSYLILRIFVADRWLYEWFTYKKNQESSITSQILIIYTERNLKKKKEVYPTCIFVLIKNIVSFSCLYPHKTIECSNCLSIHFGSLKIEGERERVREEHPFTKPQNSCGYIKANHESVISHLSRSCCVINPNWVT